MPHVLYTVDYTPQEPPELKRWSLMVRKLYEQLSRIVNGLISFGNGINRDNIDGEWGSVADTGAANTDFTIKHNLLRLPIGFIVMSGTKGGVVYKGTAPWTNTTITLKDTVANDAILVFIV